MAPLWDYVMVLSSLGASTTLALAPCKRPPTSSNLIDERSSGDKEWMRQQEVAVGTPEIAKRYITLWSPKEGPIEGELPAGFTIGRVAGTQCCTNGEQAQGDICYDTFNFCRFGNLEIERGMQPLRYVRIGGTGNDARCVAAIWGPWDDMGYVGHLISPHSVSETAGVMQCISLPLAWKPPDHGD